MSARRTIDTSRRLRRRAGYTLMEVLIVIGIIALIVTLVGPRVLDAFGGAQSKAAQAQIRSLKEAISIMHLDIGRYPTQDEGLNLLVQAPGEGAPNWNGPYIDEIPTDPWGRPYIYVAPQGDASPQIGTLGKDGQEGGSRDSADIVR